MFRTKILGLYKSVAQNVKSLNIHSWSLWLTYCHESMWTCVSKAGKFTVEV